MDGVPGERHPGLGAEAYQRPGLTTELRRIGPTRRSGLKNKPRDRDDAGFDAELSDVPIEHAGGSDQPASDRAHRRFQAGADTKGPDCADDRTERALDAERSEEHTSELQSLRHLVCRLLLEKKKKQEQVGAQGCWSTGGVRRYGVVL